MPTVEGNGNNQHMMKELINMEPHQKWAFRNLIHSQDGFVLDPRVGHTMDVLYPFISVLCHSD